MTTTTSQDPLQIIQAYLSRCNAHDFRGMQSFYTTPTITIMDDASWTPSKVTAQFQPIVDAFPDWHWETRHCCIDSDGQGGHLLAMHFKVGGTHKETFQGIEATGRKVSTTQFTLYHLVDVGGGQKRFSEVWDLTDFEAVLKQLQ